MTADIPPTSTGTKAIADCSAVLCTPNQPGAIALIELIGDSVSTLGALTDQGEWPVGTLLLARFGDVDEGLAGRFSLSSALIMPHGGPRVVQRLMQRLVELGCVIEDDDAIDARKLYPEATDRVEALMLHALARARSPLAIDLLPDQPRRWRDCSSQFQGGDPGEEETIAASSLVERSRRLNRLIDPPLVVLAGPANVGKSTISNTLLGREMSIALDQPGTTRDYTARLIDLDGLVVRWIDTPGLRESDDPIEQRAIALAARLIERADLLIAITDHEHDWPLLPRSPDLRVCNKADLAERGDADVTISATTGLGIANLVTRVREALVPQEDLEHDGPWLFDQRLADVVQMPIEL